MKKFLLLPVLILIMTTGAGCGSATETQSNPTNATNAQSALPSTSTSINAQPQAPIPTPTTTPILQTGPEPLSALAQEEQWQTYTSRDGSFSFQYPTKGRLAPKWEQQFVSAEKIPAGISCDLTAKNGEQVCQSTKIEGNLQTDDLYIPYSEKLAVLLRFTKTNVSDQTAHQTKIQQIIGTFEIKK